MRAQNLSVCVPYRGCDKECPYCVSRMTGYTDSDRALLQRNMPKVKTLAAGAEVSSVLLTGKGEPCLNMDDVLWLLDEFASYPCEMQTNGRWLEKRFARDPEVGDLERLVRHGLNVLAVSFDRLEQFERMTALFGRARKLGLLVRVTFNLTARLDRSLTFEDLIGRCKSSGVQQFSLRQVTVPNDVDLTESGAQKTAAWIEAHVDPEHYDLLVKQLLAAQPRLLRRLPYGASVFDYRGVAVSYFDYCIQDEHGAEDIRSLILNEDGHLYTAWNSPASILF